MIYKVSRMVDEHELDAVGSDTIYRDVIHRLVDDMSVQDLETIFKLTRENGDEFSINRERTHVFRAVYNTNIPKVPIFSNGEYPKVEFIDLMGELMLLNILTSDDTSNLEYSDEGFYSLNTILSAVCRVAGVDKEFVMKRTRKREHVVLRQQFYYIAHRFSTCFLREIGEYLGYDHATVLHGSGEIVNALNSPGNHKIKTDIQLIFNKLRIPDAENNK